MSEDRAARPQPAPAREFILDPEEQISALQKGRVTKLTHPVYGTTYLIDVTDREDPSRYDPYDKTTQRETLNEVFYDREENPRIQDQYASNNGVIVLITNKLDPKNRYRIYSGFRISDPTDKDKKELTSHILHSAGFKRGDIYVPFSFDSKLAKQYMAEEIADAAKESGDRLNLFKDFPSLPSGS